jgi:1-acyl-sn-glycerol-3-phosphate acyltransferase
MRTGRDSAATRAALRALNEDRILGIFPEGKIEKTRELLPFQPGVAQLAIRTGAAVYPAYIEGTNRGKEMVPAFVSGNRVRLRFGPPVEFDRTDTDRARLDAAAEAIRAAVARLRDEDLRQHPRSAAGIAPAP